MAMMEDNENKKECKKECKPEYTCSKCKVVLVKKTSTTVKNPNRDFYCCPDKKCSEFFVQWVDQSGMIKKNVSTAAVCNRCKSGCYIRNSKVEQAMVEHIMHVHLVCAQLISCPGSPISRKINL